mgnify:CR=1 FL=1
MTKSNQSPKSYQEVLLRKSDTNLQKFDLIEIQKQSWNKFINQELPSILNEFFTIDDYTGKKFTLYFEELYFGKPQYSLELCQQKKNYL